MIELSRMIPVRLLDFHGIVRRPQPRPEFLAVAKLAQDLGRSISAMDVANELLMKNTAMARGVLRRCIELNLLAGTPEEATLTAEGIAAIERDAVLIPEEGVWRVHQLATKATETAPSGEPFLPERILHVERIREAPAHLFKNGAGTGTNAASLAGHAVKSCIDGKVSQIETTPISVYYGAWWDRSKFYEVSGCFAHISGDYSLELRLTWKDGETARITLTGAAPCFAQQTREGEQRVERPVSLDLDHGFACLHGIKPDDWLTPTLIRGDADARSRDFGADKSELTDFSRFTKTFSEMSDLERRTRRTSVELLCGDELCHEETREGIGAWEKACLTNITLTVPTETDATEWLHWLQWDAVSGYMTPARWRDTARQLSATFADYPSIAPLDEHEALAAVLADRHHPKRREILAPYDLGLRS